MSFKTELIKELAKLGITYGGYELEQLMEDIEIALEDESTMIYVTDGYEDIELYITKFKEMI